MSGSNKHRGSPPKKPAAGTFEFDKNPADREVIYDFGPDDGREPEYSFDSDTPEADFLAGAARGPRVVTNGRLLALEKRGKLQGFDFHAYMRSDVSRRAMANNANPFAVFMPCFEEMLRQLHSYSDYNLTLQDIDRAITLLSDPAEAIKLTGSEITSNWGLSKRLREINEALPNFLYDFMLTQYGRHGAGADRILADFESRTLAQAIDFNAVFSRIVGNRGPSYVLGEMLATLQYVKLYDPINYQEFNKGKNQAFTLEYTDPVTKKSTKLVEGEAQPIDKTKNFTMNVTITADLPNDQFVLALQHALMFSQQYIQFTSVNKCPVTNLSENPEHNILMVLMAAGQFGMHVAKETLLPPPNGIATFNVTQQITDKYGQNSPETQKLLKLWQLAIDFAQIPSIEITDGKQQTDLNELETFKQKYPNSISDEVLFHKQRQDIFGKIMTKAVKDRVFKASDLEHLKLSTPRGIRSANTL